MQQAGSTCGIKGGIIIADALAGVTHALLEAELAPARCAR
jgi:hypothetical protein